MAVPWRALAWAAGGGVAALVAALVRPGDRTLVLDVYLLYLGGLALLLLVRATAASMPGPGRSALERAVTAPPHRPGKRPAALDHLERMLLLSTETAFEVHYRLRPVLREIAAHRLSTRLGVELDGEPETARDALGPAAWELVRPDREPPPDRLARGARLADLRAAVEGLEGV